MLIGRLPLREENFTLLFSFLVILIYGENMHLVKMNNREIGLGYILCVSFVGEIILFLIIVFR